MNAKAKGYILGSIAAASYGMNPLFALPLYKAGMDPDSVLFFRYLFAIPLLGIMIKARGRSFKIQRKETFPLIIMGLLVALSSLTLFLSYNYMAAGIASTLLFVYPIMVALIMAMVFKEKLALQTIVCMLLALGGIGLLYKSEDGSTLSLIGTLLVFASSLSYAIYIVGINQTSLKNVATLKVTFYVLLFGLSLFVARLLYSGVLNTPDQWYLWANLLALAVFPTAISFLCTTGAIQYIGSTPTSRRFPPARHSRRIGARDSHLLRNSRLWRKPDSQRKLRTGDDYRSRNVRHRRRQYYKPTGPLQETVPKTPDKKQEKKLIL